MSTRHWAYFVEIDGRGYYTHSYVDGIAHPRRRWDRFGDLFAVIRGDRIVDPRCGDGSRHLWAADAVDAAEALYEFGADGVNGFGFDRDGYGPDGRHAVTGYTRAGWQQVKAESNRQWDAHTAQRSDQQQRTEAANQAAILELVDDALRCVGKSRSRGGWGWVAEILGGGDVLIANVPRNGACRRCSATGTQQGMPRLTWDQGSWNDFTQCGTCGSVGGVNAPYRVITNPTVEKLVAAVRELAGRSA